MSKNLILLLVLSSVCFGQRLWNGTRYGMSAAELEKLFGSRLKHDPRPGFEREYTLGTPEHFCGGDFSVDFVFLDELDTRLSYVSLREPRAKGAVGKCVLEQLAAELGQPKAIPPLPGSGHDPTECCEYWFHKRLSNRWTIVLLHAESIIINYTGQRPSRYASIS
jgi:hypothetical protein